MAQNLDGAVGKAARIIESVLKGFGLDPDKNRIQGPAGGASWQITRGSADIMIAVNPGPDGRAARLRLISPLVKVKGELEPALAGRLLQLNAAELPGIAFGLFRGDIIALVAERSVADLDRSEVEELLASIGHFADKYDDLLVKEFGGTRVCDLG
jgi:hypothetical protein